MSKVTRIEVIDESGRAYVRWNADQVQAILQDDGRTLKVFVNTYFEPPIPSGADLLDEGADAFG